MGKSRGGMGAGWVWGESGEEGEGGLRGGGMGYMRAGMRVNKGWGHEEGGGGGKERGVGSVGVMGVL